MSKQKQHFDVKALAQIAIFTALLVVCAQITVPMPFGVPLTMQTFGILLAGSILGASKGFIAVFIYLLLGALGLPVLQGFNGGLSFFFGPTGGFLFSFPLMPLAIGLGHIAARKIKHTSGKYLCNVLSMVLAVVINLSSGMLFFAWTMETSIGHAFQFTVLPFILVEAIKIVGATILGYNVRTALLRGKLIQEA